MQDLTRKQHDTDLHVEKITSVVTKRVDQRMTSEWPRQKIIRSRTKAVAVGTEKGGGRGRDQEGEIPKASRPIGFGEVERLKDDS